MSYRSVSHVFEATQWLQEPWGADDPWVENVQSWKNDSAAMHAAYTGLMKLKSLFQAIPCCSSIRRMRVYYDSASSLIYIVTSHPAVRTCVVLRCCAVAVGQWW